MIKRIRFLLVALIISSATIIQSQVTTSNMSGRVTDAEGTVIGATVVATHEPSGTTYGTVTNRDGRYNLPGMRVGGPYTVEITYIGYGKNTTSGITLKLGESYVHNVELTEESVTLNEVVVSALRTKFTTEKTGATTNISNEASSFIISATFKIGTINFANGVASVFANRIPLVVPVVIMAKCAKNSFGITNFSFRINVSQEVS